MSTKHGADRVVTLLLSIALLAPSAGGAQNFGGARPEARYFRVEIEGAQSSGRIMVWGHVYNTHYRGARNVSLLIEGLDGSGRVVSKTVAWVNGDVHAGGRRYFEAQAPTPGTTFRGTVLYYDWVPGDVR